MSTPDYDERRAREVARAWVQGITLGALYEVEGLEAIQARDDAGNYLPWFEVVNALGRVRVSFETVEVSP